MLKRVIQLVVAAVLIYAGYHAGVAYFHYYQFTDAIGELALFAGNSMRRPAGRKAPPR